jgi:polar amino acid transport system permease protein
MNDLLVVWEHRDQLITGLFTTLGLVATAGTFSLLLGALLTPALMSPRAGLARLATAYVDAMRSTPLLLFVYVIYFALPNLGVRIDNWWTGAIALVLYNTAYFAELMRGAWTDLPPSLIEAGRAYGFTGLGLLRRIVLPPVLISAMPLIGNQLVQIVKDSAFLTIIAVSELTHEANSIQSTYFIPFASFVVAVILYWAICLFIEGVTGRLSRVAEERRA